MTLNRAARIDELVEALLGTEARRWIKNLPPEEQGWLAHCGPRQALPEWLLDMRRGGDFIPLADQISAFADIHLPADLRESTKGAMGDSMYVIAAARLIPSAARLRDQLLPLLDHIWGALNDNDHRAVFLALPTIAGLAGQARQMLESVDRPADRGRKRGSGFNDDEFVDEYRRRHAEGERPETLKHDIALRMPGGGTLDSKKKRLERRVNRRNSLPSSPMK